MGGVIILVPKIANFKFCIAKKDFWLKLDPFGFFGHFKLHIWIKPTNSKMDCKNYFADVILKLPLTNVGEYRSWKNPF